jgi:lipoprotein-releasing system ATP-binding protein
MADARATPVLRVEGVTKDYGTSLVTRVLRGVTFEVHAGEFAALVGPSGSGKSTLLNLMGLLDRPTSGRLLLEGQDTSQLDERALTALRGRRIGFIFQFHHLLPAFTAAENVLLPMYSAFGERRVELVRRARDLCARVGLTDRADYLARNLSGGQQQRVAIARALAMDPPLVLADEPTGNLDTHTADQIFALLREFHAERGGALVVVTHDPRLAARCDRVLELVDGQIVRDETSAAR